MQQGPGSLSPSPDLAYWCCAVLGVAGCLLPGPLVLRAGAGDGRDGRGAVGEETELRRAAGRERTVPGRVPDGHGGAARGERATPDLGDRLAAGDSPGHRPAVDRRVTGCH